MITASGTPDECRAQVRAYVDAGLHLPDPLPAGADVQAMLDAFAGGVSYPRHGGLQPVARSAGPLLRPPGRRPGRSVAHDVARCKRALAAGADAFELDVHATADGHLVVCHDATVDRTTDASGAISAMTLAELRALDNAYWWVPGSVVDHDRPGADYPLRAGAADRLADRHARRGARRLPRGVPQPRHQADRAGRRALRGGAGAHAPRPTGGATT